jgi:hypothetical protein
MHKEVVRLFRDHAVLVLSGEFAFEDFKARLSESAILGGTKGG